MKVFAIVTFFISLLIGSASQATESTILEAETQEVIDTFSNQDIKRIQNYCEVKKFAVTCGQLITFKNIKSFIYNFSALERQVGATVYYLEKENGRFKNVLDEIFDGKVGVDKAFAYNSDLVVTFDKYGFPTVKDVKVIRHGTTRFLISDLVIGMEGLDYTGFNYDSADPNYKEAWELHYDRSGLAVENPSEDLPVVKHIKRLFPNKL